jgi:hypothetical protein
MCITTIKIPSAKRAVVSGRNITGIAISEIMTAKALMMVTFQKP